LEGVTRSSYALQVTRAICCCERITKLANSKGMRQAWGGIPAEQGLCTNE
jgi:hypothetical protein